MKKLLPILFFIFLLTACEFRVQPPSPQILPPEPSPVTQTLEAEVDQPPPVQKAYFLEYHNSYDREFGWDYDWYRSSRRTSDFGPWDAALFTKDEKNTEHIVLESIKKALPALQINKNFSLLVFSQPEQSTTIFRSSVMESDSPLSDLYLFDVQKGEFVKIFDQINLSTSLLSPRGNFLLTLSSSPEESPENVLEIFSFQKLKKIAALELKSDESFLTGEDLDRYGSLDISWQDESRLRYAVYDSLGKKSDYRSFSPEGPQN